jgi:hypothetical protein
MGYIKTGYADLMLAEAISTLAATCLEESAIAGELSTSKLETVRKFKDAAEGILSERKRLLEIDGCKEEPRPITVEQVLALFGKAPQPT